MIRVTTTPRVFAFALVALTAAAALTAAPKPADNFFKPDELGPTVALCGRQYYIPTVFGPTGLDGWILADALVVREVEPGSPADGIVQPNDTIIAANGKALGDNPLKTFGQAIEPAEQSGTLELTVERAGKKLDLKLTLRKLGAFGKDWPYDDTKSRALLIDACRYLARNQNFDGSFDTDIYVGCALDGLAWLATQDPNYWENARRLAYHYREVFDPDAYGTVNWDYAYMGVFLSEYYFQTGDRNVLPMLRQIAQVLARNQQASGTWGHGPHPGEGYVQGGALNNCALVCWMALELIKETGTPISELALVRATKFFTRFVNRGTTPYGNHRPEFLGGNGKNAIAGVALSILGDKWGSEYFARMVCDTYRTRNTGHTGGYMGFVWGNVQGARNPHYLDYRRMLDEWTWLLDASRRWDGGFLLPDSVIGSIYTYRGPVMSTGGCVQVYAMPTRTLRIYGAPKGLFTTRTKDLPENIRKGVNLLQARNFKQLRKTVKPDSDLARELLAIAGRVEKDIQLTLKKIDAAMAAGNPNLARKMALNLDRYTYGRDPQMQFVIQKVSLPEDSPILAAGREYEHFKWLTYTYPPARKAFEKLATDPTAGIYRTLARRELATPDHSPQWIFYGELMYDKYSTRWTMDDRAKAAMMRIASIRGGDWTKIVSTTALYKAGILTGELAEWTPLVAPYTKGYPGKRLTWHRLTVPDGEALPAGWADVNFDDAKWQAGPGPLTYESDEGMRTKRGERYLIRIPFTCDRTNYKRLRMAIKVEGRIVKAACYVNGTPVLWAQRTRDPLQNGTGLTMVDLPDAAIKLLKKGKNDLAVRTYCEDGDFSLYASDSTASRTYTPRPKSWNPGPTIAAADLSGKTPGRVDVKSVMIANTTGLTIDPAGKCNEDYFDIADALNNRTMPIAERAKYFGHYDPRIRLFASLSLMVEGEKAMPYILKALDSKDVRVIRSGCDAIAGRFGFNARHRTYMRTIMTPEVDAPAVPKLVALLDHPDMYIREGALLALSNCGKAVVPYIGRINKLSTDPEWWVRAGVARVMEFVAEPQADALAAEIIRGFGKEKGVYGKNRLRDSLIALAKRGQSVDPIIKAFVRDLNGPDDYWAGQAIDALGKIGPAAKGAEGALNKRLAAQQAKLNAARSEREANGPKGEIQRIERTLRMINR